MKDIFYLALIVSLGWISCSTPEEDISFDSNLEVFFSTDTVAFDTILSDSRSSTRRLTVLNPNESAIRFSNIRLGEGIASDYSIIINGKELTSVQNEVLHGGDSLLVLVELNVDPRNEDDPYLVKDSIIFEWNTNSEHIKLVAYGQDGNKLSQETICDELWTRDRPYIVSDTLVVGPNCTLTIEAGTKIFFENDAALFIQGTLNALGDSSDHILFRNARFDGIYDEVPGQWNGVYFLEGSDNNQISYTEIFNGQIGLRIGTPDEDDTPDVSVANSRIYNMSTAGILAFTSDVSATNTLIYNCGTYLVGNFAGGNYSYLHCTLSNDPSLFVRDDPSIQFSDNILVGEDDLITEDLTVSINNSILWGSSGEELLINNGGGASVTVNLSTNIIKSATEIENNFTSQEFDFPGFEDPFTFDYSLDSLAFAIDKGTDLGISKDINGKSRDSNPDIGAFERIQKE